MVGVRGFEPPTPASRTQCSTRLSHTPTFFSTRARGRRCAEEGAYSHGFRTSQAGNLRLLKKSLVDENSSVFRCCIPESLGVSHRSSQQRTAGRTGPAGEWCNGNTAVFGTVVQGSSPCSPANHLIRGLSDLIAPPRGLGFIAYFKGALLFSASRSFAPTIGPTDLPVT
jgi:hypothetical protein